MHLHPVTLLVVFTLAKLIQHLARQRVFPGQTRLQCVPAAFVLHIFEPLRAGQIRGVTGFAPVLVSLIEIDQYNDAARGRKKTAAMF